MKGMNKIIRGFTFKSVLLYCEGRGEKDGAPEGRLIGGNMSGQTVSDLMKEFIVSRRLRPDIEKATWHNSLRLPTGDHLEDKKWCEVVEDYMQRMGFSPTHPYCIWSHDDEDAVHIVASRIGFDGVVYLGQNENLASTRHIQDLERIHGLRLTKGPEYLNPGTDPKLLRPVQRDYSALKKSEINKANRTGDESPRMALQKLVQQAAQDSPTVVQFAERLTFAGVVVRANLATTGVLNGFSFEFDGAKFKGSELGKLFSWKGLQAQGVNYEQARDCEKLGQYSAAARSDQNGNGIAVYDPISVQSASSEQRLDARNDQQFGSISRAEDRGNSEPVGSVIEPEDRGNTEQLIAADESNGSNAAGDICPVRSIGGSTSDDVRVVAIERYENTSDESAADLRSGRVDRADRPYFDEDAGSAGSSGEAVESSGVLSEVYSIGTPAPSERQKRKILSAEAGEQSGVVSIARAGLGSKAVDIREGLIADHKKKVKSWRRQAVALGAPMYRVSLIGCAGHVDGQWINLGKPHDGGEAEHFYDAAAVEALIPQLRRHNAMGFDIHVTPIDKSHHYIVIDGMKPGAVQLLSGLGHAPCLVQSSNNGSEQAVLKVPRLDRPDEQALANQVVQQLNMAHGDPKSAGVVQPFGMAGFSNKKVGRESTFTRILEAGQRICHKATDFLQQLRQAADDLIERARKKRQQEQIEVDAARQAQRNRDRSEIDVDFDRSDGPELAFRRAVAVVSAWVRLHGLTEDATRVDLRAAMAMLGAGWSEAQVRAGMLSGSDDLAARHTDPDDYVWRMVSKASIALSARQVSEVSAVPRPREGLF